MLTLPRNFDVDALGRFVLVHWDLPNASRAQLEFQPLGKDSWNFRLGAYFVSLRRDLRGHVENAYVALRDLVRDRQIDAVAPLSARNGEVVARFQGMPVLVFDHIAHHTLNDLPTLDVSQNKVLSLLAGLHQAKCDIVLPKEDFRLSFRSSLAEVLDQALGPASNAGPFAHQAQSAIAASLPEIQTILQRIDQFAETCRSDPTPFVLTHGEPLPSNLIATADRALKIIDFTELAWGPPERDLFHIACSFGWDISMRPAFHQFYTLKWQMSEIEEYGRILLAPHSGSRDDIEMFRSLHAYLPQRTQSS